MTQAYRRTSVATQKRKASNCRSDSSIDSTQNNSSVHKKKSKKGKYRIIAYLNECKICNFSGFLNNIRNNNIGDNSEKSIVQKIREFFHKRNSYSLFIFSENSK